jgi:hypothetical protein
MNICAYSLKKECICAIADNMVQVLYMHSGKVLREERSVQRVRPGKDFTVFNPGRQDRGEQRQRISLCSDLEDRSI